MKDDEISVRHIHKQARKILTARRKKRTQTAAEEQPRFRPITGYRTDQVLPKIKKAKYTYLPGVWRGRGPTHKFLMNIPMREWKQLVRAANDMEMPISLIIRLSYRRFMRAYLYRSKMSPDGTMYARAHRDKLLTRAELEVAGQQRRGPYPWPTVKKDYWGDQLTESRRLPPVPYAGSPQAGRPPAVKPAQPMGRGDKRRLFIVPKKEDF